jgi:hypothetical protein
MKPQTHYSSGDRTLGEWVAIGVILAAVVGLFMSGFGY